MSSELIRSPSMSKMQARTAGKLTEKWTILVASQLVDECSQWEREWVLLVFSQSTTLTLFPGEPCGLNFAWKLERGVAEVEKICVVTIKVAGGGGPSNKREGDNMLQGLAIAQCDSKMSLAKRHRQWELARICGKSLGR